MRTRSVIILTYLSLALALTLVLGEDENQEKVVSDNDINKQQLTPFEEGLQPFYQMTNIFLGVVQNKDLVKDENDLYEKLAIGLSLPPLTGSTSQPAPTPVVTVDMAEIGKTLTENWQSIVTYSLGYAICISIGLLFIVIMPIVGCCFCCCRLCGRCGGKTKPREGRHHKCRQYTCGTLLFIFNTIMLVGMIFAFMTNEHMRVRLSPDSDGLVPRAQSWFKSFTGFTNTLVGDIENTFDVEVENELNGILKSLNGLPEAAVSRLDKLVNSTSILQQAEDLASKVSEMKTYLETISDKRDALVNLISTLTTSLQGVKTNVLNVLNACSASECTSLANEVRSLEVSNDFTNTSVDTQKQRIEDLGNIKAAIDARKASYNEVTVKIRNVIQSEVNAVDNEKNDLLMKIRETVKSIAKHLDNATAAVGTAGEEIGSVQPYMTVYGTYWWYAGIGLSCVFLLIVLCYYLGIMFGACGEPPFEDANACNKGVGANLLLAGVGFAFLFSWLMMLICTILFIPGALMQGEVCRHVSPELSESPYLTLADQYTYPFLKELNITNNVSQILLNCKNNEGVYKAVGLSKIFHLDFLNLSNYNVKGKIDQLENLDPDLTGIKVIDSNTEAELAKLRDSELDSIDFAGFFQQLDKQITSEALSAVISKLENIKVRLTVDGANQMDAEITKLRNIQTTDIQNINIRKGELREALDNLMNVINGQKGTQPSLKQKAQSLITDLNAAQANIDNNTAFNTIKELFKETALRVYRQLEQFTVDTKEKIKNDVGNCRNLYNIVSGLVNVVCVDFLYPFNGFWFSFGWCLAFFIPSIITAVHLAGSYRKTEEYDPTDTKSFDDPNFDAYSGGMFPGDNIPLEDYDRRKNRPGGRGQPNSGYVTDSHPSSRAPPAAMPYRDNYSRDHYAGQGGPPAYAASAGGPGGRGGGGGGGGYGGATPPNPPHYYNNRPGPY